MGGLSGREAVFLSQSACHACVFLADNFYTVLLALHLSTAVPIHSLITGSLSFCILSDSN